MIVQKYGGATLSEPNKIKAVAERLASLSSQGTKVVAVVSAMGQTTNQLIQLANQVSHKPNRRELDMLLTTGERISMALVTMALHDLQCPAISFTGSQAGILTDSSHFNACIQDVKATRVTEALNQGQVVVLAGFQGVFAEKREITTLGRGGSDTTAVAMAAFLQAEHCEILKDVPAVFTADPKLVSAAKEIPLLNYDQLLEMTFWGAKVLHYRSVELAKIKKVRLYIGPAAEKTDQGTWVEEKKEMFETTKILAINSHENVLELSFQEGSTHQALISLQKLCEKNEIAPPQILNMRTDNGGTHCFLTAAKETLLALEKNINTDPRVQLGSSALASVTATCTGNSSPAILTKFIAQLENNKIPTSWIFQSAMSITAIIPRSLQEKAVQSLHTMIIQDI